MKINNRQHDETRKRKEAILNEELHIIDETIKHQTILRERALIKAGVVKIVEIVVSDPRKMPNQSSNTGGEWLWYNKSKGEYQFGKVLFAQKGKIRRKVFTALMDLYGKNSEAISVQTLADITGMKKARIRIEINAISGRLKKQIGFYFEGSGKGYYTLQKNKS